MLDEDEARRQRIERRRRAEKIPARDIDADAAEAQNTPPVNTTNSQSGGDEMGKMTVEELDQHRSRNRMKVCKPRALTVVPVSPVAIPQVAPAATSETAPASHPLVLDSSPRATYRAPVENASLVTPARMQRLWRWLFAAPIAPTTTDLVQLKRNIKEWTALQNKVDRLETRRRHFVIRSEIARYIFLIITAAFYVLVACAALRL